MIIDSRALPDHDDHDATRFTDSLLAMAPVIERYTAARAAVTTLTHAPDTNSAGTDSDTGPGTGTAAGVGRHPLAKLVTVALAMLLDSVADIPGLLRDLYAARLRAANLAAAGRAALAAERDGDPDPLWFLRDELDVTQVTRPGTEQSKPDRGQPCELGGELGGGER